MKDSKIKLRKQILDARKQLSSTDWRHKNEQICQNLKRQPLFMEAQAILGYFSFRQEPDLSSLFNFKKWGFPRCENNSLTWHFWQQSEPLENNKYNILEPLITAPQVNPQQVDLILVPTVACSYRGYRLGYGGGYYDRFLSSPQWRDITTVGIVFDFAYLPQLPIESWDIKLDYICTESMFKAT